MIHLGGKEPAMALASLAAFLSPGREFKSTRKSPNHDYSLAGSGWVVSLVREDGEGSALIGLSLHHPDMSDEEAEAAEKGLCVICHLKFTPTSCVFLTERTWEQSRRSHDRNGDCGIECLYRVDGHTLRITVRNYEDKPGRAVPWKSVATAEVCLRGQVTWKTICELPGNLMRSRNEHYFDSCKAKYEEDVESLLNMSLLILQPGRRAG